MMKGLPMTDTIETYQPMPISTDDFLRLKAAVADRDPKLRLNLEHTEDGAGSVAVMTMPPFRGVGQGTLLAYVERGQLSHNLTEGRRRVVRDGRAKIGWRVYHPDGPLYEFAAIPEVANFLAFGDTQCCRRSSMKVRRARRVDGGEDAPAPAAPKDQSGSAGHTTTTLGSKEGVVSRGGAGSRGRYLPMLGDRAGE
jgi:hypothetical protein